ncbi:hypothetical protein STEG23_007234 [Scotinomys teguina]
MEEINKSLFKKAKKTKKKQINRYYSLYKRRSSQSPLEEEPQSLPRTQEQPVTLRRRGPKSNQSPLEEEDPGAASHPRRTSPSHFLRPMGSQSPSEEEDPGAASQTQRKMTKEQSVTLRGRGPRSTQTPS